MGAKRYAWRAILIGSAALVALGAAGARVTAQQAPNNRPSEAERAKLQKEAQERAKRLLAHVPQPVRRSRGPAGRIAPAYVAWQDSAGRGGLLKEIDGCLPAGPGVDVVWNRGRLFLMKQKGRLKLAWEAGGVNDYFGFSEAGGTSVCFDGRYVWAALTRLNQAPLLIVLDPQSEKTWQLSLEDGLPAKTSEPDSPFPGPAYLAVGPVEPGKACVAASIGSPALALVEFDPESGASVKAIPLPESSETSALNASGQTTDAGSARAWRPVAVLNLTMPAAQGKKRQRRIAISRQTRGYVKAKPLIVDLDSLKVDAAASNEIALPINNSRLAVCQGWPYWVMRLPIARPPKLVLARATLPQLEEELLFAEMPEGKPVLYNDCLAFLGERCWLWKPGEKKIELVDVHVPWTYSGSLGLQASVAPRKVAGEEWALDKVYASENYGALIAVTKQIGPKFSASDRSFFQFALADDPRASPDSPVKPPQPELAIDIPAGNAASELKLFAAGADHQRPQAILGKVAEGAVDDKLRYPVLAREIVRQALLIAARDQLQWGTRDGTLSEALSAGEKPAAHFALSMRFPYGGAAAFELQRIKEGGRGAKVWQEQLVLNDNEQNPLDYARLVEAAERWSRQTFPDLLRQDSLSGEPNPPADDANLPDAAAKQLEQMSFMAQFAAVRELHRAIRRRGESNALLGALVRGYANLGVLSEFHWNSMHKACKARALLYAQRLVVRSPESAEALWHRAYAKALSGVHDSAVADLDAAKQLRKAAGEAGESPRWVSIIDAYCAFRTNELGAFAERGDYSQLAGLLQFFHLETLKESAAVQILSQQLMERNPENFRLLDALCDCCAINTLHAVTQLAPAVLHQTAPLRLQRVSGLPAEAVQLLPGNASRTDGLTKLADSLASTPAEDDQEEFSWRILGRMLQETEFIQLWRRVYFMRFQWAVPTEEFIDAVADVATGYRYRPLIELCSTDAKRWQTAAETVVGRMELEELDFVQLRAFQTALGQTWQTQWTQQYAAAERRATMHSDDVYRDLLLQLEKEKQQASNSVAKRLLKVSAGSPDAAAAMIRQRRRATPEQVAELEKQFPYSPQVWKALSETVIDFELRRRVLQSYIKLSPDMWAYRSLAFQFQRQGKMDEWKATLDESLRQPSFGLEHAQVRVQIANYYMNRSEWEKAEPYAAEAAETWAEWAMLCAIRCYRGLGDDKNEGVWRARVAQRYPKTQHSLDLYVWSRRTGQGNAEQLFRAIEPSVAAAAPQFAAGSQFMIGLFYHLGKQPRKALAAYHKDVESDQNPRSMCFSSFWTATLAQELGEVELRDQSLQRMARLKDPKAAPFRKAAEWVQAMLAADKQQRPDLAAAREIAASAEATDRTGVNCFIANFLDLTGRKDDAVAFYRAAIAEPAGRFTATYAYVCATLRDRGLMPAADADEAEEGKGNKPSAERPAEPEAK